MTERPILFSGPMVQTILDGRKTQTRRIMKPQPPVWINEWGFTCFTPNDCISGRGIYEDKGPGEKFFKMKYGDIGDRLWVREKFIGATGYDALPPAKWGNKPIWYCADGEPDREHWWHLSDRTRPSIHMPRWASRLTLEITEVRVQRVQEISEEDAKAEGVTIRPDAEIAARVANETPARMEFWALWESINGPGSWAVNPWVWCVSFKKVTV